MIRLGDLTPIIRGDFRREHCTDTGSEALFDFISRYRQMTDGQGRIPALSVIQDRFPHIVLPETSANIDLAALTYEARSYKTRMSIQTLQEKLLSAIEAVDPISELRLVRSEFDEIMKEAASTRDLSFAEAAMEILDDYSSGALLKRGVPWPWPTMNEATQGMHGGDFYIIAGRPKSRKTFIALYVAAYLVQVHKLRVLFVSPEMSNRQVMLRFMAFVGVVPYAPFKSSSLSEEDEQRLFDVVSSMRDLHLGLLDPITEDSAKYTVPDPDVAPASQGAFVVTKATAQPVSFIEMKIKEHRPHVVIVDSFYRLGVTGKAYDSDWKVITTVSRNLKDIAAEHEVVLIGTHQLNREADDKVGSLANLGYADAIGQDCDMAVRVITAKRPKTGDRSALVVLGARESPVEGVLIHNEPCNNFDEIEPLLPGNRKKLLSMLVEEDEAEALEESEKAAQKPPSGFSEPRVRDAKTKASTNPKHNPSKIVAEAAAASAQMITPDQLSNG